MFPQLSSLFTVDLIHTGQHFDPSLNADIFADLGLKTPDIMMDADNSDKVTTLKDILCSGNYNGVIVYGDTNSTLWGASAAKLAEIPLIHIESGERSYNPEMPEENNRIQVDRLSTIRFCVSLKSLLNLQKEGLEERSYLSGDIMKDFLLQKLSGLASSPLTHPYYFASIHRNYTQQDHRKLLELLKAINQLNHRVIFSLHPSTRISLGQSYPYLKEFSNIQFIEPVTYSESIALQYHSIAVLTDSGGIQREAYWMKKRCITLRKETEWIETLDGSWNQLVYDNPDLPKSLQLPLGPHDPSLYGTGNACEHITRLINELL